MLRADLNKLGRVILSCRTEAQLNTSRNMIKCFTKLYGISLDGKHYSEVCECPNGTTDKMVSLRFIKQSIDSALYIAKERLLKCEESDYGVVETTADFSEFMPEAPLDNNGDYDFFIPDSIRG